MWLSFDHPWYLALLVLAPWLWIVSFRNLLGLGRFRRMMVLSLRSAVIVLLVLSLAQAQWVRINDRVTVLYVLDQSLSIPEPQRRMMADFVKESVARHRSVHRNDRAGVIVFAKEAAVEYPPVDENIQLPSQLETPLDTSHTNLSGAEIGAVATLPVDSASRVVLVTDGNENLGNALAEAQQLADAGIGIDVVPIRYYGRSDVAVEKLAVPPDVQAGQPFDLRVVLNNTAANSPDAKATKGQLQIFRKTRDSEQQLANQDVELEPGKKVFNLHERIDAADAYTYTARFIPDDETLNHFRQNKEVTGFTQVRGQGRVLLVEDSLNPGEFDLLADRRRHEQLNVTVINTDELFTSLAELHPYDTVILANVPREAFSDQQIKILVANTQRLGAGLIMLGGPNSFGAGGWGKTELEEALPVDCEVKNLKVRPVGALALVIDRSGSMNGEKLAMAKTAAMAATDVLADTDYVTVTAFDFVPQLVVPIVKKGQSQTIRAHGSPRRRWWQEHAAGHRNGPRSASQSHRCGDEAHGHSDRRTNRGIRLPTIGPATSAGENHGLHRRRRARCRFAAAGGNRTSRRRPILSGHYAAGTAAHFSRRSSRGCAAVGVRRKPGFQPQIKFPHEMLKGIDAPPPPITGFVLTTLKDSPLVEVALQSPLPTEDANRTLLASWTYGLGKVVALTTDAGRRWSSDWSSWPDYDKLFSQIVRWSMRPVGDQGKFTVATDIQGEKVHVTVNALDKNDEYLNFLCPTGSVVGPDMKPQDLKLEQTAPGRYVGEFAAPIAGSYFFMLSPLPGTAPIVRGVDVPYSSGFLDHESNDALLASLAALQPAGSERGLLINGGGSRPVETLAAADVFRHNLRAATSRQDVWPQLLLLASGVFFCDVFVRRVRVDLSWLPSAVRQVRNRVLRREAPTVVETIARLRSRKSAVAQTIETQRAALRFEPQAEVEMSPVAEGTTPETEPTNPSSADVAETPSESYTSR